MKLLWNPAKRILAYTKNGQKIHVIATLAKDRGWRQCSKYKLIITGPTPKIVNLKGKEMEVKNIDENSRIGRKLIAV